MGGTIMDTGSITVMDKDHKTIMYHYKIDKVFVKYLIVLHGIAYAITCTTSDLNRLDQIFPVWIQVATSFRLLA